MVALEGVAPSSWVYKTHALLLSYRAMFAVVPGLSLSNIFQAARNLCGGQVHDDAAANYFRPVRSSARGSPDHNYRTTPCGRYSVVKVLRVCLMPFPSKRPACLSIMRLISATYKDLWRCFCSVFLNMLHLRGHRSVECATWWLPNSI